MAGKEVAYSYASWGNVTGESRLEVAGTAGTCVEGWSDDSQSLLPHDTGGVPNLVSISLWSRPPKELSGGRCGL